MAVLEEKYITVLEGRNWRIYGYTDDNRVELGWNSPAGEDFSICVDVDNLPEDIAREAAEFDGEEHVMMWLEAKKNGFGGVPSMNELVKDAEDIEAELRKLAEVLMYPDLNGEENTKDSGSVMYVISLSHGEYDDHMEVAIGVTENRESAELIVDALNAREPEYMEKAKKAIGNDLWWDAMCDDDCSFWYNPVMKMEV